MRQELQGFFFKYYFGDQRWALRDTIIDYIGDFKIYLFEIQNFEKKFNEKVIQIKCDLCLKVRENICQWGKENTLILKWSLFFLISKF